VSAGEAGIARAAELALAWHAGQTRRGSGAPYAGHLLQVAGLVLEHGGDLAQCAAALLHDALEDVPTPEARREREGEIAGQLGAEVLRIVLACTDTGAGETLGAKAPWRERKQRFLASLPGLDARSLLVVACDKRHNLGDLVADVRSLGAVALEAFRGGPEAQVWYFEEVSLALRGRIPERLDAELAALAAELRALLTP
jgi:(p)ppGpp synthase/HD superfamily hydrolase